MKFCDEVYYRYTIFSIFTDFWVIGKRSFWKNKSVCIDKAFFIVFFSLRRPTFVYQRQKWAKTPLGSLRNFRKYLTLFDISEIRSWAEFFDRKRRIFIFSIYLGLFFLSFRLFQNLLCSSSCSHRNNEG